MTTYNYRQLKLPTPEQAIAWGIMPHCLGLGQQILAQGAKGMHARTWMRYYLHHGGPIGDAQVLLGWYGREYQYQESGEVPMYIGATPVSSRDAVHMQRCGRHVARFVTTEPNGKEFLWRLLLEESGKGFRCRVWLSNYFALGGEIVYDRDFFRNDRIDSGFGLFIRDIAEGGKAGEVARNLIAICGSQHDLKEANITEPIGDAGAFEAQQERLMRTFHCLPNARVNRVRGVLDDEADAPILSIEELHILADQVEAERRLDA
jgi:hypothetical protein